MATTQKISYLAKAFRARVEQLLIAYPERVAVFGPRPPEGSPGMVFGHNLHLMARFEAIWTGFCIEFRRASYRRLGFSKYLMFFRGTLLGTLSWPCYSVAWPCHGVAWPCYSVAWPCYSVAWPCYSVAWPCHGVAWPCYSVAWPCHSVALAGPMWARAGPTNYAMGRQRVPKGPRLGSDGCIGFG